VKIKALPYFETSGSTQSAIKSPQTTRTKSLTPVLQIYNVSLNIITAIETGWKELQCAK